MAESEPLVSIGLPTYNRVSCLEQAIESVLAQTYSRLELVVSDNASTDATASLCEAFCARDTRVRYVRQETNLGATENFRSVLRRAQGPFFMWLGDDDWLDPDYIAECMTILRQQPDHALVCGQARYFEADVPTQTGVLMNLNHDSEKQRVLAYYQQVEDNGTFYGVMRRDCLAQVPLRNALGSDWLVVAALAFQGKVRTLETVCINRRLGGATRDFERTAAVLGVPNSAVTGYRSFYARIAATVFQDIAWGSPVYRTRRPWECWRLGLQASGIIQRRFIEPYDTAKYHAFLVQEGYDLCHPELRWDVRAWLAARGGETFADEALRSRHCLALSLSRKTEADTPRVNGNGAVFVSQSVPRRMRAGRAYRVSLTLRNTGTTTWTEADRYRLGSQDPENNMTWDVYRLDLPAAVGPGDEATLVFRVGAPPAPGAYTFTWRMVQDLVEWFGDPTPPVTVTVYQPKPFPPGRRTINRFLWLLGRRAAWRRRQPSTIPLWLFLARTLGIRLARAGSLDG